MGAYKKASDLRQLSAEELDLFLKEKREALLRAAFSHHTGQLENVSQLRHLKREIARGETLKRERVSRGEA